MMCVDMVSECTGCMCCQHENEEEWVEEYEPETEEDKEEDEIWGCLTTTNAKVS